jgi:hypothetical protein
VSPLDRTCIDAQRASGTKYGTKLGTVGSDNATEGTTTFLRRSIPASIRPRQFSARFDLGSLAGQTHSVVVMANAILQVDVQTSRVVYPTVSRPPTYLRDTLLRCQESNRAATVTARPFTTLSRV